MLRPFGCSLILWSFLLAGCPQEKETAPDLGEIIFDDAGKSEKDAEIKDLGSFDALISDAQPKDVADPEDTGSTGQDLGFSDAAPLDAGDSGTPGDIGSPPEDLGVGPMDSGTTISDMGSMGFPDAAQMPADAGFHQLCPGFCTLINNCKGPIDQDLCLQFCDRDLQDCTAQQLNSLAACLNESCATYGSCIMRITCVNN